MNATTDVNAIRAGFAFDEVALARWMEQTVRDYAGPLRVRQFTGGQSNPTYRLETPGRHYVLRRKPPGRLLQGAHAVDREARILTALGQADFPVPHVYGLCTDESIIGTWFYVMELVEGRIIWDASFGDVPVAERATHFDAMNTVIAQLHSLDPSAVGLSDFARPGDYYAKQLARWTRQYRDDPDAGTDPVMDRLIDWLGENLPAQGETRIVHGDYRCDNMIFHPVEPKVVAVLDWELSTLGDPLADFANHAMMYHMPPHIVAGLAGADLIALEIPSEAEYLAAYCARTGIDPSDYDYAVAFGAFRLAAIFHGIKGRYVRGTAVSQQARDRADLLPELIALAWEQAKRAGAR